MASDAAGLIGELDLAPAHVVGVSMGGMIGQTLAAEHPELVRSLTSIMSTTGNRWRGQPSPSVYRYLLRPPPTDREGFVERATEIFGIVGSTGFENDPEHLRDYAARSYRPRPRRRPAAPASSARSSPRATAPRQLAGIKAPTLVIHGTVDRLVRPSGGKATARAIPGAKLMMVEGMGHDLPRGAWPRLIDAIASHAEAADAAREPEPVLRASAAPGRRAPWPRPRAARACRSARAAAPPRAPGPRAASSAGASPSSRLAERIACGDFDAISAASSLASASGSSRSG